MIPQQLLLRGPRLFSGLRIVNGDLCSSFHEACFKLDLLEDDRQYHLAMQEASLNNSPSGIRGLFSIILAWCEPSNRSELYDTDKNAMAEDFLHYNHSHSGNLDLP